MVPSGLWDTENAPIFFAASKKSAADTPSGGDASEVSVGFVTSAEELLWRVGGNIGVYMHPHEVIVSVGCGGNIVP